MDKPKKDTGNPAKIRGLNRNAVLSYVRQVESTSRVELVKSLELSPATVTAVVAELLDDNLLLEVQDTPTGDKRQRGRPTRNIRLNPNAAFALGVSFRVEHNILSIDTAWSDYCNHVSFGPTVQCAHSASLDEIESSVLEGLRQLTQTLPKFANIVGLGIGIPGVVKHDEVLYAPNIAAIMGKELHKKLASRVSCPVYFENDVNLLVVEELEKREELRMQNVSYLFVSQGVGAGTALHGELWRASSWSGEIGHIDVPFEGGGYKRLEWLIGLDGYFAEKMLEQGITIDSVSELTPKILDLPAVKTILDSYTFYLFLAVQVLNGSFGLNTVIIGTSNPSILNYCMPKLLSLIEQSPLKVQLIHTAKGQNVAVKGATLLALKHSLSSLHHRKVS